MPRLPEVPPIVGRARERARLGDLLARRNVAVVAGPGGSGKTHLALRSASEALGDAGAVYVPCPSLGPDALAVSLLRALTDEQLVGPWAGRSLDAIVELAEDPTRLVVVDDLHHAPPDEARALVAHIAANARRGRWVLTTRAPAELGAEELLVMLGAMSTRELEELAHEWLPGAPGLRVSSAVEGARGSPWQLKRLLFTADAGQRRRGPSRLAGLLSVLRVPVDASFVGARDAIDEGVREGWIVEHEGRVRLHDEARPLVQDGAPPEAQAELAGALARSDDNSQRLEGLRLWLELGAIELVGALLAEHGRWLAATHGPELWAVLRGAPDALRAHRMRIAAIYGAPWALAELEAPGASASLVERTAWLEVLYAKGCFPILIHEGAALADQADREGDRESMTRAATVAGIAAAVMGDGALALALSARATPSDADERARWRTVHLLALVELERDAEATDFALESVALLPSFPPAQRALLAASVMRELYRLGRIREAERLALELSATATPASGLGLRTLHIAAAVLSVSGGFERARALASVLARYEARGHGEPWSAPVRASLAFERGDLAALRAVLDEPASSEDELRAGVEALRARLASYACEPLEGAWEPTSEGPFAERLHAFRAEHAWRAGEPVVLPEVRTRDRQTREVLRVLRAAISLYDPPRRHEAAIDARRARDEARERGHLLVELDATVALAEHAVLVQDRASLSSEATALDALARRTGSARIEDEAALFAWLAGDAHDPSMLLALVESSRCLRARRRALALGGAEVALDRADALLVPAMRAMANISRAEPPGRPGPAWVVDGRSMCVGVDGRTVDLRSNRTAWRLLEALLDRGGHASKEELVASVWSPREYHPLKHDNRLRLLVRRLRAQIEEAASPARIVTTEDGYALAGAHRWA